MGVDSMRDGCRVAATPGVQRARVSVHRTTHSPLHRRMKARRSFGSLPQMLCTAHTAGPPPARRSCAMQAADSAVSMAKREPIAGKDGRS
jgi:hypothetical protein